MSFYTTFKTWDEMLEHLKSVDYPQCFMVNYLPEEEEYALWIGNQPYEFYEHIIEQQQLEVEDWKQSHDKIARKLEENEREGIETFSLLRDANKKIKQQHKALEKIVSTYNQWSWEDAIKVARQALEDEEGYHE